MKPSAKTIATIAAIYADNEASNSHSENVVLLAEHFGDTYQKQVAHLFLEVRDLLGHTTNDPQFRRMHDAVQSELFAKFQAARNA